MLFTETTLKGAYIVDLELIHDNRGFFGRGFDAKAFEKHGLNPAVAQVNLSYNHKAGTLRGMHYLTPPGHETKFIRVIRGAIYDVIVDLRPESPTYMQHVGVELNAENRRALYVPELFAHGFQTLTDDTELLYMMGNFYSPGYEGGMRYDDPVLGIEWPLPVSEISEKDKAWPLR